MFPDTKEMKGSQTRFTNLISAVRHAYSMLQPNQVEDFLKKDIDLNFISRHCETVGINRINFTNPPAQISEPCVKIVNGLVVDLEHYRSTQVLSKKNSTMWIHSLTGLQIDKLGYAIDSVVKKNKFFHKQVHRFPEALDQFLNSEFSLTSSSSKVTVCKPIVRNFKCDKCDQLQLEISNLSDILMSFKGETMHLENKVTELSNDVIKLKSSLAEQHWKSSLKYKKMQRKLKKRLAETRKSSSHFKKLTKLRKENSLLYKKLNKTNAELQLSHADKVLLLEQHEQEKSIDEYISLKTVKNTYSDDARKAVIALMCDAKVAAVNVANVINIVSTNIFHYKFKDFPSTQTCINMLDEGYVISNFQVAEAVLKSQSCTLHSDGTSRDHKKIVGHQLTLNSGEAYYLGFTPVATEDANTLLDIAVNVFKKLSFHYDSFSENKSDTIMKDLLSKITSTMSDRAATMKSFNKKFEELLKSELGENTVIHFLHCNAHFLLGLSSSCEKAIKSAEADIKLSQGRSLGRDQDKRFKSYGLVSETATSRVIRTVCDVLGPRGDQKNGCRVEWTTFCEASKIPSFKNNRFNCFFEAASSIIFHLDKIQTFFTCGFLSATNLKLQSVLLDVKDTCLMSLVCCIAIFHLKFTAPYWTIVTSQNVKYFEFYKYVQCMIESLEKCGKDPHTLLDPEFKSIFQKMSISFHECYDSNVYEAVHNFINYCDRSLLVNVLKTLCTYCLNVTKKQLHDFLDDGYFINLGDKECEQLTHCSLTNLIGESAFGDLDFDVNKRRNTTLHNRSATHCIKRNKTLKFLRTKSIAQQRDIFSTARKLSKIEKKESTVVEQQVRQNVRARFLNNQEKKIKKEIKDIEKRSVLTGKVKTHGGPCQTPQDVDKLVRNSHLKKKSQGAIREIIKNEIRFQKIVLGRKNLQFGPLNVMVERLKMQLENNV